MEDIGWDSSFPESVLTVAGSDFDVTFTDILQTREPRQFTVSAVPYVGFTCEKCRKVLKTARGLKSHLKLHALRDAAVNVISKPDLKKDIYVVARDVLVALSRREVNGPPARALQDNCVYLLLLDDSCDWKNFVEEVSDLIIEKCLPLRFSSPAALHGDYFINVQRLLADSDFTSKLAEKLSELGIDMEADIVSMFLGSFVRHFAKEVLLLLLKSLRHPQMGSSRSVEHHVTISESRICHYVAGSVIKGILREGLRRKEKSPKWSRVVSRIHACFTQGDVDVSPEPETTTWTALLDIGRLTYVGQKSFQFFLQCLSIAKGVNPPSRYNFIQQIYQSAQLLYLWEDIVKNIVLPDESTWLMELICRKFYNTYCKGAANKARNNLVSQNQASVSTRKRLATK